MIIRENIPISTLTTMHLGGPARFVIEVETLDDIPAAYDFAKSKNLPVFILGGGANTIGHDEGFNGVIIINRIKGIDIDNGQERLFEGPPERGSARVSAPRPWQTAVGAEQTEHLCSVSRRRPADDLRSRRAEATQPEKSLSDQSPITAMGGEIWDDVVAFACERGLTGIEGLSKIPGLAAAAPVQNIGAYGQEVADTLVSLEAYDTKTNQFVTLTKDDLHFSYRHSILNTTEKGRYFVISITLVLKPGQMERPFYNSIEQYIEKHQCTDFSPQGIREIVSTIRADKLPDPADKASSGSFFKNIYLNEEEARLAEEKGYPVYHGHDGFKINSGWLIEEAGLKGKLLHGMRVSDKAALVLINESATSYADLAAARAEIIDKINQKFGYQLEQEPVEIL